MTRPTWLTSPSLTLVSIRIYGFVHLIICSEDVIVSGTFKNRNSKKRDITIAVPTYPHVGGVLWRSEIGYVVITGVDIRPDVISLVEIAISGHTAGKISVSIPFALKGSDGAEGGVLRFHALEGEECSLSGVNPIGSILTVVVVIPHRLLVGHAHKIRRLGPCLAVFIRRIIREVAADRRPGGSEAGEDEDRVLGMVLIGSEGEAKALDVHVLQSYDIEPLDDSVLPFRAVPDLDVGGSVALVDEAVLFGSDLLDGDKSRLGGGDVDGGAGFQRDLVVGGHVELLDGLLAVGQGAGVTLGSPGECLKLSLLQDRVLEIHGRQVFHRGVAIFLASNARKEKGRASGHIENITGSTHSLVRHSGFHKGRFFSINTQKLVIYVNIFLLSLQRTPGAQPEKSRRSFKLGSIEQPFERALKDILSVNPIGRVGREDFFVVGTLSIFQRFSLGCVVLSFPGRAYFNGEIAPPG